MPTRCKAIVERFSNLLSLVHGPLDVEILGLASPQTTSAGRMIFLSEKEHLRDALDKPASAWVVSKRLLPHLTPAHYGERVILSSANIHLAMALIGREFFPQTSIRKPFDGENEIHPSAVIAKSAKLAPGVLVGPHTTIGANVQIGEGCVIGANTTIEPGVTIGPRSHIHSQVYIAYDCVVGADCEIHPQTSIGTEGFGYAHDEKGNYHRLTHYGRVVLKDRVHIGAGVMIDRGTFSDSQIGFGTIIDNYSHFGHNIKIGQRTIVTGGFLCAGSVTIGDQCVFGGRTSVAGHIEVTDNCQFAGLSGISNDVRVPGLYGGYPVQPLKQALRTSASLRHVPNLRKQVRRIMKKLGLDSEEVDE